MSTINGIDIFREVGELPAHAYQWLDRRNQLWVIEDRKGREHTFIENDTPRDADVTEALVANTVGFALFNTDGDYIGSYRDLERAEKARATARVVVTASVEDADPDDDYLGALGESNAATEPLGQDDL